GHGVYDECAGSRVPTDNVRGATGRGDSVEGGVAASGYPADWVGKSHVVYASRSVRPSIAHASAGTEEGADEGVGAIIQSHVAFPYERRPEGEMCKSENLPRELRITGEIGGSLGASDTAADDSGDGALRARSRTEAIP